MGNKKTDFGSGGMVYTIIFQEYNGEISSVVAYGPPDKNKMISLVLEEYARLVCLIPGHQEVLFPPAKYFFSLLTFS